MYCQRRVCETQSLGAGVRASVCASVCDEPQSPV